MKEVEEQPREAEGHLLLDLIPGGGQLPRLLCLGRHTAVVAREEVKDRLAIL